MNVVQGSNNGDVAFGGIRGGARCCEDPAGSSAGQHQSATGSHGSLHGGAPCNALGEWAVAEFQGIAICFESRGYHYRNSII